MISTSIRLRKARKDDVDRIVQMETRADMSPFLYAWGHEKHERLFADPDHLYLVADREDEPWIGFVILSGVSRDDANVEIIRVSVVKPGSGAGTELMTALQAYSFDELDAHRIWLDVFEDNARARRVYQKTGFREEGLFREAAVKQTGERVSLVIMAMLRHEWQA